jgi:hypothetical protein
MCKNARYLKAFLNFNLKAIMEYLNMFLFLTDISVSDLDSLNLYSDPDPDILLDPDPDQGC